MTSFSTGSGTTSLFEGVKWLVSVPGSSLVRRGLPGVVFEPEKGSGYIPVLVIRGLAVVLEWVRCLSAVFIFR